VSHFTDAALITRVLVDDDRNAFGELVRRHQSQVRSLLMKLTAGNKAEADDLAQETFIRAYRHIRNFKGQASFSTWLYRIACNQFLSSKRGADRIEYHEDIEKTAPAGPFSSASSRILARIDVERAMEFLRPMERAALTLSCGHEMPHDEIAQTLDCPLGTVKTYINRARAKIMKKLASYTKQEPL
jgi:RNA polymerase sigma factor (sigma-70 family)